MIFHKMRTCFLSSVILLSETSLAQVPVQQTLMDTTTMESWTYADQKAWSNIPASECSREYKQSPVELPLSYGTTLDAELKQDSLGKTLGPIVWTAKQPTINVSLTTGATGWKVVLKEPANLEINEIRDFVTTYEGQQYVLESMTFHSPSEHTVDENHHAMEVQLNHYYRPAQGTIGDNTKRLVISVLMDATQDAADNAFLGPIWHQAAKQSAAGAVTTGEHFIVGDIYPDLLSEDRSFVIYDGTKTVPPCESSKRMVMLRPQLISATQLNNFRGSLSSFTPSRLAPATPVVPSGIKSAVWDTSFGSNNREIKELGGRTLQLVQQTNVPDGKGWREWHPPNDFWNDKWWSTMWISLVVIVVVGVIVWIFRHHTSKHRDPRRAFGQEAACCEDSEDDIHSVATDAFHKEAEFYSGSPREVTQALYSNRQNQNGGDCCGDCGNNDEDEFEIVPMPQHLSPLPPAYTASTLPPRPYGPR
mmetsp:Transcript_70799/g.124944  ORF Transcript_70799/g.124944 Transcript_70799/m.124944 type:complete len:476 (+) Transcript_70799:53-1480(+)|eukprot:CAMPEP_0197626840 /NCGR_PEP_ID=MMETSP1338-20131121/5630_1 /TAXON_ID=43686 ORGANISM="Pelagodinium beii, Strain RCC1491" /NCGR_SAMPLE_ID=MMETSP1338 /ASSEMBLY_ACC=CAM_ASM_000754 /LENGTH=475 /DNA_ID=CAMNT_0043197411 /DNA_START=53 /DNA_END=1480 /DNA_ORIENTATION=+